MRDLTVEMNVSDDSKIVNVSLELDGVKQADLVAPPFVFDIHHLKTGPHTLVAKAQDDEENEGMATVKVTVPAPGDVGATCAGDDDCQSQRCVDSVCARTCSPTQTCPNGYHCDDKVCIEETGGCNVGSSNAAIPIPLMLLFLGLALRRPQ